MFIHARAMRRRLLLALVALAAAPGLARAEGGEGKKRATGGDSYIAIDTLTAYMTRTTGRRGVMTVDCGLDVPDAKLRARTQLLLPRLRAAFVQAVQIYAGGLPEGMPPNAEYLARTLQRLTDQALGARGARLLLGAVIVN
jgi:hypothetical protein